MPFNCSINSVVCDKNAWVCRGSPEVHHTWGHPPMSCHLHCTFIISLFSFIYLFLPYSYSGYTFFYSIYIIIYIQCNYLEPPNPAKVLPIRSLLPILSNSFPACMFLTCSKYLWCSPPFPPIWPEFPHLSFPRFPFPFRPPAAPWWEAAAAPLGPAAGPVAPPSAAGPPPAERWRAPGGSWPRPWKGLPGAPAHKIYSKTWWRW